MTDGVAFSFTDEQADYLRAHVWAVLATGRRDGSPQVSTIGYVFDGERIAISAKSYTAKWHNAQRQPKVALVVHDGRAQLVVYGTVTCFEDDPERAEWTAKIFEGLSGNSIDDPASIIPMLDQQQRTVLLITPTSASFNP
jgi:PPOX class probable F420-dependent enzyme